MENKRWWWLVVVTVLLSLAVASADAEVWEESEHEVLIRNARGAKNRETPAKSCPSSCRCKHHDNEIESPNIIPDTDQTESETDQPPIDTKGSQDSSRTKDLEICRYVKGAWSGCDAKTNIRSRTLTLKKGDAETCDQRKVIQKKCKKPCRYEKSTWSECGPNGQMVRLDKLKSNSDTKCEPVKRVTRSCNKQTKGTKDKGRRNRQ